MEKFYEFIINLIKIFRPKHNNWVVKILLLAGLGLLSQTWWIPYLNLIFKVPVNPNSDIEITGWILVIVALATHFYNRKEEITLKNNQSFSVSVDCGLDPVESKEYLDEEPKDWNKALLRYRFATLATSTKWSNNTIIGIVFFSADRLYKTESDIPEWIANKITVGEKPVHHRVLHHSINIGQVNSAQPIISKWFQAHISINHTPWDAAVYVLPEDAKAQWFQFTIKNGEPSLEPQSGQGVQVRGFKLKPTKKPLVAAKYENLI